MCEHLIVQWKSTREQHFSFKILFYSRNYIKHSENIFHILRAIQNVLHGFSSWIFIFLKHIQQFSDALTCTVTKHKKKPKERNKTHKKDRRRQTAKNGTWGKTHQRRVRGHKAEMKEKERERELEEGKRRSNTSFTCRVSKAHCPVRNMGSYFIYIFSYLPFKMMKTCI